ncbi:MAG: LPD7 domain-containing protein, partial [Terracidiphilus sp.]
QEAFPKNLRTWVADRASEGDARAAAQLRGWRFADQRNQRRLDARLEANAMHISPPSDHDSSTNWVDLAQQRLAAQQEQQALANQIAATRIWKIDRKTGDVSYTLNGRVSVIDHGRIITVLNQDEASVLFGLEMAIQKYGPRIACTGTKEWKRMVTKTAAQHGVSVQFTDEEMQHALRLQRQMANPRQRQQKRGGR